ncbi:MAG TPA: FAD-dependent oxidoreductase [Leptospiraceae bacterium]|nr:FAD-dependent oxidoreductase [Spirochaetaceae bacterium]HBS04301.1 FAD-dependent oxidoreductase [Leptospiraceae bacterium]|tara:strand:- start:180606 stop:181691 length:1086 start_codon:yes stop_codon:yes gene_type:complete
MIDLLVIGGGIVGSWVAYRASQAGMSVALCDSSHQPGDATSGRNSGVLHAGIYYQPDSLKAFHCIRGYQLTVEYLESHKVPYEICGKLITTGKQSSSDTLDRLEALKQNAERVGARDLTILQNPADQFPGVLGQAAILSPNTGVCDAAAYLRSVQEDAKAQGTYWLNGRKVASISLQGDGCNVLLEDSEGRQEEVQSSMIVNSAGLYSDEIARMTGLPGLRIHPVRGEYYRLRTNHSVGKLVYPLPDPTSTALGVHYTFHPGGDAYAGPNAVPAESKEDYRITQSATDFAESLGNILTGYSVDDLSPGYAGLRPRLYIDEKEYRDFYIRKAGRCIHLLGIESPGLTSAASISLSVHEMLGA